MKYEKSGFGIKVRITDCYTVRANILKGIEENTYEFDLELSRNDIGQYQIINEDGIFQMESLNINTDVSDYIRKLYGEAYFTPYMDRYEYWIDCMNLGTQVMETYSQTLSHRNA